MEELSGPNVDSAELEKPHSANDSASNLLVTRQKTQVSKLGQRWAWFGIKSYFLGMPAQVRGQNCLIGWRRQEKKK